MMGKWIQRPRCAILPSPEKLETRSSAGQDTTNTRGDFNNVWRWLTLSKFLNTEFYKDAKVLVDQGQQLEEVVYKTLVQLAFSNAFAPIRNTSDPEHEEMVLLYYAGHGLDKQNAAKLNRSSSPRLDKAGFSNPKEYFEAATGYITKSRPVKGGELCLHDVGFCDLEGLLEPWIAALKSPSMNATGAKKNKHLIVIADSCYSGMLVEDLQQLALRPGPWNQNGCTVTVQSACHSDEPTTGGYFTPCFVYFNQPENQEKLRTLKKEWKSISEEAKNAYRQVDLPTPQVATTMPLDRLSSKEDDPIMVLPIIQDFQLTLFHDGGFFKFCFLSLSGIVGSEVRALTHATAKQFLSQSNFKILDYKLKITRNGTPMALVPVEDPNDKVHVVCVHIHFYNPNTSLGNVSGVNLIHHKRPTNVGQDGLLFLGDNSDRKWKFTSYNTTELAKQCNAYVEAKEPGRWADVTRWNMTKSFNCLFRLKERSAWMNDYVKKIQKNPQTS